MVGVSSAVTRSRSPLLAARLERAGSPTPTGVAEEERPPGRAPRASRRRNRVRHRRNGSTSPFGRGAGSSSGTSPARLPVLDPAKAGTPISGHLHRAVGED